MPLLWPILLITCHGTPGMPLRQEPPPVFRPVGRRHQLHAGDQVEILIWRRGAARVVVDREGKMRHPLFGELDVAGWSEADLSKALERRMAGRGW